MKSLVAGGAGFLGSHLCDQLLLRGEEVICLDDLSTGRFGNISHLISHDSFEFIEHDVRLPIDLKVDRIYNLASPASPFAYQADPVGTLKTNVLGSMNLLELALEYGARILQASTSEVYGDPLINPQVETYWGNVNPVGVRSCYDEGKRASETLFFDYSRSFGVEIKVVRIFNTYGPRMAPDDGRVMSNFITQALDGLPLTVYGSGLQTRSFCYVDDMIGGMLLAMDSPGDFRGPVNLGNPEECTILELIEVLEAHFARSFSVDFMRLPKDDPQVRRPDISLAKEVLAWEPVVTLREGVTRTVAHFEDSNRSTRKQ